MDRKYDPKGGTDELFVSIPVLFADDAFGNEHATEEHTGQKIGKAIDFEDELAELEALAELELEEELVGA